MARSGAKRRFRGTLPGNRLNVRKISDDELMAAQPHRAGLPEAVRMSAKAVTLLGRLNLLGRITDEQYEAGMKYHGIVHQYASSIGIPMDGAGTSGKGYPCLGERNCEPCECRRRKERYDKAFRAVSETGQKAARAVAQIAVHDRAGPAQSDLKRGLDALAIHFGIDTQYKVLQTRNAG